MRIESIQECSLVNGIGVRTVIFFAGCPHACEKCHSPELWDMESGKLTSPEKLLKEVSYSIDFMDGITLSGGEPLIQDELDMFLQLFKKEYPTKTVWLYTGYEFPQIPKNIKKFCDFIVDGKYDFRKPPTRYKGSDNQNIYQKINDENWVILHEY